MPTGNYPLMSASEWSRAPFNQDILEPVEFNVTMSSSMSKNMEVKTRDYKKDDDGDIDTYDTNWVGAASESNMLSPIELIKALSDILKADIASDEEEAFCTGNVNLLKRINYNKYLLEQCKGWTEDEIEVVPY